jgi:hypothetical protein
MGTTYLHITHIFFYNTANRSTASPHVSFYSTLLKPLKLETNPTDNMFSFISIYNYVGLSLSVNIILVAFFIYGGFIFYWMLETLYENPAFYLTQLFLWFYLSILQILIVKLYLIIYYVTTSSKWLFISVWTGCSWDEIYLL